MYTCSHLYYVYGKSQLWLQTQWPSSIAGCSIVSLFAKWNNSMIWDISPLITQGLQLASMSAPFTDGYDAVLFIAKYLQSIDEHCTSSSLHCQVYVDEHCRGGQTIISTLPSICWTLCTWTYSQVQCQVFCLWPFEWGGRGVQVKDEWDIMWECCVAT